MCHSVCEFISTLDQVIWLAENLKRAWHLNSFSRTRVKIWEMVCVISGRKCPSINALSSTLVGLGSPTSFSQITDHNNSLYIIQEKHTHVGHAKQKSAFEHVQKNVWIHIILHVWKVSSGSLLYIDTCTWVVWSGSSLSTHAPKAHLCLQAWLVCKSYWVCKSTELDLGLKTGHTYTDLIELGFNDTSTIAGHFVSSPKDREKRDRRDSREDEREGQGRKENEWKWRNRINKNIPPLPFPAARIAGFAHL